MYEHPLVTRAYDAERYAEAVVRMSKATGAKPSPVHKRSAEEEQYDADWPPPNQQKPGNGPPRANKPRPRVGSHRSRPDGGRQERDDRWSVRLFQGLLSNEEHQRSCSPLASGSSGVDDGAKSELV